MFNFLKSDPLKKLVQKHARLLEEAMHIQRNGDLKLYAKKMVEIDAIEKEIEKLRSTR